LPQVLDALDGPHERPFTRSIRQPNLAFVAAIIASGFDEPSAVDMPIGGVFLAKPYDTARVTAEAGRRTPVAA
jgi:hypothetical protein